MTGAGGVHCLTAVPWRALFVLPLLCIYCFIKNINNQEQQKSFFHCNADRKCNRLRMDRVERGPERGAASQILGGSCSRRAFPLRSSIKWAACWLLGVRRAGVRDGELVGDFHLRCKLCAITAEDSVRSGGKSPDMTIPAQASRDWGVWEWEDDTKPWQEADDAHGHLRSFVFPSPKCEHQSWAASPCLSG